jgi:Na+/H+-dicarboxylate symporter
MSTVNKQRVAIALVLCLVPALTLAQVPGQNFLDTIMKIFINPIVMFIFSLGMVTFMYGLLEFMWKADYANAKETGGKHMMYGMIGMLIMVAVWGVIAMVTNTLGLQRGRNGLWE